jgi:hypothetical protein
MQQLSSQLLENNQMERVENRRRYNKKARIKDIELCIKFDNYFANLASILNFSVESAGLKNENIGIILEKITKDLMHLQENYTIIERDYKDQCVMNNF